LSRENVDGLMPDYTWATNETAIDPGGVVNVIDQGLNENDALLNDDGFLSAVQWGYYLDTHDPATGLPVYRWFNSNRKPMPTDEPAAPGPNADNNTWSIRVAWGDTDAGCTTDLDWADYVAGPDPAIPGNGIGVSNCNGAGWLNTGIPESFYQNDNLCIRINTWNQNMLEPGHFRFGAMFYPNDNLADQCSRNKLNAPNKCYDCQQGTCTDPIELEVYNPADDTSITHTWNINHCRFIIPYAYRRNSVNTYIVLTNTSGHDAEIFVDVTTDGGADDGSGLTPAERTAANEPFGTIMAKSTMLITPDDLNAVVATMLGGAAYNRYMLKFEVDAPVNSVFPVAFQEEFIDAAKTMKAKRAIPIYTNVTAGRGWQE
jgi:hypothetical protein